MTYVLIRHEVADYDEWKPYFDDDNERRVENGQLNYRIFRDTDNPNEIVMLGKFDSEEGARSLVESEELPEIMKEAGVKGEPEIYFLDQVEKERSAQQPSA